MSQLKDLNIEELQIIAKKYEILKDVLSQRFYNLGDKFFAKIVENLNNTLNADFTFVGKLIKPDSVETISLYSNGQFLDNFIYNLKNTPCEKVINQKICCYTEGVIEEFPDDILLKDMKIEAYAGVPLYDNNHNVNGVLVSLFKTPIEDPELVKTILLIHARQAGAELEHQRIYSKLTEAKEKAEETNRLKQEFLQNMSHEIRTPMNGILGFTDLLNNDNIKPDQRTNYIKLIKSSGQQLLRIINDIIEISTLAAKKENVKMVNFCVHELIIEIHALFMKKSQNNNLPFFLKNKISEDKCLVKSDKSKVTKILTNLIENAFKFTKEGFIELGSYIQNNSVVIYIKDTGIGIDKDMQGHIFNRFSQESPEIAITHGGLGLGLSICKENADLIGAHLCLESEKGNGSTFYLSLPYNPTEVLKTPKVNKTKKILIAEDEQINYIYLESVLLDQNDIKLDIEIVRAQNGKEAVDYCNLNKVDIILMDIKMPIMNGLEATRIIHSKYPEIPIIAQTAYSTRQDFEAAIDAGCKGFISKPINKNELLRLIVDFIGQ